MWDAQLDREWRRLSEEVLLGMKDWRAQHPRATLREIEIAVDERLAAARARLLEAAALASAATDPGASGECPTCPDCGATMRLEGRPPRRVTTTHDQTVTLTRRYA